MLFQFSDKNTACINIYLSAASYPAQTSDGKKNMRMIYSHPSLGNRYKKIL